MNKYAYRLACYYAQNFINFYYFLFSVILLNNINIKYKALTYQKVQK